MTLDDWGNDNPQLASIRFTIRDTETAPPDVQAKETLKKLKKADIAKIDFILKQLPDTK